MREIQALTVGHPDSHPALLPGTVSRIHSTFTNTVNLVRPDGELWTLATRSVPLGPRVITLDIDTIAELHLANMSAAHTDSEAITHSSSRIVLSEARSWAPDPTRLDPISSTTAEVLALSIARHGIPGGVIPDPSATPIVAALSRLVCERSITLVRNALGSRLDLPAITHLLGAGIGTTPAGDDFLTGYAAASHALGAAAPLTSIRAALRVAPNRTNPLAATAIRDACEGLMVEPLHGLLEAIATSTESIDARVRRVIDLGHSSGTDLVAGVLAALAPTAHLRWATQIHPHHTRMAQGA